MKKLRIAWFSPLNVSDKFNKSISAYVSDILLPLMRDRFEIELFHDSFESYRDFPTFHYLQATIRHAKNPYDIFFYQIEDSLAVNFIRIHLGIMPGITLFHNALLRTDGPEPILHSPWQAVVSKYNDSSIPWHDRYLFFDKISSCAHRELAFSIQPLFSSLHDIFFEYNKVKDKRELFLNDTLPPLHLPIPVRDFSKANCDFQGLKIAFAGEPNTIYRTHKVLSAFDKYDGKKELHWLINSDEIEGAKNILNDIIGKDWDKKVFLYKERNPYTWDSLVKSCNVAIHTYFYRFGNVSPYLQISLGHNLPTIVSNYSISNTLPDNTVYKIEVGDFEATQIVEVLNHLSQINRNDLHVNDMVREYFDPQSVADSLSVLFNERADLLKDVYKKWGELKEDAKTFLINEIKEDAIINEEFISSDNDITNPRCAWERAYRPIMQELGWLE